MKRSIVLLCLFSFVFGACSPDGGVTHTLREGVTAEGHEDEHGMQGLWSIRNEHGQLIRQGEFEDGCRVGHWTSWWGSGRKKSEGERKDHHRVGIWTFWYANGQKVEVEYIDGVLQRDE